MKNIIGTLSIIIFPFVALANPTPIVLPDSLQCKATYCIFGEAPACSLSNFSSILLSNINVTEGTLNWNDKSGMLFVGENDDKVSFDFSINENSSIFTFRKDDIADYNAGRKTKLNGTYEDGIYSIDTFRTVSFMAIDCTK